ncbi:MAG TPA: FkbM family methyltransferase [Streptosporangiaceae bacterium]
MKILWHSVAPYVGTGYGQQTGIFAPRIRDLGHDVALSVYYGLQGAEMNWNGLRCMPGYAANYGSDVLVQHALTHFGAENDRSVGQAATRGIVITLGDVWTFETPLLNRLCVGSWVPVDHLDVPAMTRGWFRMSGAVPIAMSRFGEAALRDAGFDPLYVPHGIDLQTFCPGDKAEARAKVGVPEDVFVVGMVANNVGRDNNRKAFAEQITAFAELRKRHGDVMMVLHTDVDAPGGMDLRAFLRDYLPEGSYTFTEPYTYRKGMNPSAIADILRAIDVLSCCSYGEGFGIPIIEAQACSIPVVVTDATAMPELCGSGWRVPYERMWHESQVGWVAKPLIGAIADAYEQAYEKARDESMRAEAFAFAQDYGADVVTDRYWRPVLDRFEAVLAEMREDLAKPPRPAPPRVREADGLLWLDRGPSTGDVLGFADHEAGNRAILEGLLPEGGVLLDVGAHVGHWALRLAAKASKVVAVEANPATAATLRRHVAMNGIGNVEVVQLAAWDEQAYLSLDDPSGQVEGGSTRTVPADGMIGAVQGDRLDKVITGLDRLDLVKLDVEGADIHALRGMAGLLAKYRPVLFVECHDIYGYYDRADLEQTLTDLGYGFEVAASVPSNWMPDGPSEVTRQADYLVCRPL